MAWEFPMRANRGQGGTKNRGPAPQQASQRRESSPFLKSWLAVQERAAGGYYLASRRSPPRHSRASPIRTETHSLSSNAPESSQSTTPQPGSPPDKATSELALFIAERLDHQQADDIKILDVSGPLVIADYFIIATVNSTRQARSLAKDIEMEHKAKRGRRRRNGGADAPDSNWVLIDFGDIVVHLFLPEAREYYGLEGLWADVPRLPFTPSAPREAANAYGEVRQPTLDGFGTLQPLTPEDESSEDESPTGGDNADSRVPEDLPE